MDTNNPLATVYSIHDDSESRTEIAIGQKSFQLHWQPAMKNRMILITVMLSTTILSISGCSHKADTMTSSNARTFGYQNDEASESDAGYLAQDFIGTINYARIALAKNKGSLAQKHIDEARSLIEQTKDTTVEEHVSRVESGRVVYEYDTDYKYHYFPMETGPMEVMKMGHGPIWAKKDLAVTDAEIVYLTIDLSGDKAEKRLTDATAYIKAGNLKAADVQLAKLTDEVVTVDDKISMPLDKAQDNIALARNFIAAGNYAGVRYALKHADNALDEMQKDDTYEIHRSDVTAMRKDVKHIRNTLAKKDPTMLHKADAKLSKWWSELKSWNSSNDNQRAGDQGYGIIPHLE